MLGLAEALKRLEPYVVKVASTVLRRGSDSQYHSLIRQDDEQGRKPLEYTAVSNRFISFCTCKKTDLAPLCDASHRKLENNKENKNDDIKSSNTGDKNVK